MAAAHGTGSDRFGQMVAFLATGSDICSNQFEEIIPASVSLSKFYFSLQVGLFEL